MRSRLDIIKTVIKEALEGNSDENPFFAADAKWRERRAKKPEPPTTQPATQTNTNQEHIDHLKSQIDHHASQLIGWGMPSGDTPGLVARSHREFHRGELEKLQAELRRITGGR